MAGVADLKLVLIGSKNVGKTSVFNRYVYDEFGKTSMTIGAYFGTKTVKLGDRTRNLAIWDTAGEEKFDSLTNFYCRGAAAALVCYDITSYESFAGLQRWVDKIIQEADKNCAMILVGNKLDIVEKNPALRKVDLAEAKRYASSVGATVVEASAKNGTHVTDIFEQVVQTCLDRQAGQMQTSGKTKKSTGTATGGGGGGGGSFPEPKHDADKSKCCS